MNGDGSLDKVEFLLLAHDRSLIFSQENLLKLFQCWYEEQGAVSVGQHIQQMIRNLDGAENPEKIQKLYEMIEVLRILRKPLLNDII